LIFEDNSLVVIQHGHVDRKATVAATIAGGIMPADGRSANLFTCAAANRFSQSKNPGSFA